MRRALAALILLAGPAVGAAQTDLVAAVGARAPAVGTIVVTTEPNAVHVVSVPVPEELRANGGRYEFVRQNGFSVLGSLEGSVARDPSSRAIVVSVVVPSSARSGRNTVGLMHFTCTAGCEPTDVSIIVDVSPRFALQVDPDRPLIGAHAGERIHTRVTVHNAGNDTDRVTLAAEAPSGWAARILTPQPVPIGTSLSAPVDVEITVGAGAGLGDYATVVEATSRGGTVATASIVIHVGAGQRGVVAWRPVLEATTATVRNADGTVGSAFGASLSGEVFPDVLSTGEISIIPQPERFGPLSQRSLGRLGFAPNVGFLRLDAKHWDGAVGNVGYSGQSIAGVGIAGIGSEIGLTTSGWRGHGLAVRPNSGRGLGGGQYFYGDAARRIGRIWLGAIGSDLSDLVNGGRDARTVAATFSIPSPDGALELQAGTRETSAGSGLAWRARAEHHRTNWGFGVGASHLPGGAHALAASEDQVNAEGFARVTSFLSLSASGWHDGDGAHLAERSHSDGWTASPTMRLGALGDLSLMATSSAYSGSNPLGTFGTTMRDLSASWSLQIGAVTTRLGGSHGTLERQAIVGDIDAGRTADRSTLFATVNAFTRLGTFSVDGSREATGAGVGVPSRQLSFAGRATDIPLWAGRIYGYAEGTAYYLGASNSGVLSQVVGAHVQVTQTMRVSLDVERGGFERLADGSTPWVVAMKVQRGLSLPAIRPVALRGLVFADRNGDGKRNAGEPGMPGAVIRIDGEPVTANEEGRFALGRAGVKQVEVDPLSLPPGWMATQRDDSASAAAKGKVEIGVVPTTPVDVTLRVAHGPGLDTTNLRLDRAVIILTDSMSRRWTGAPSTRGTLHFDALPPGVYQVSADVSGVGEILLPPDTLPTVRVDGNRTALKVELVVRPRPIRVIRPAGPPGGPRREPPATQPERRDP